MSKRTCSYVDRDGLPCGKPHEAQGYCCTHYRNWSKDGDPTPLVERPCVTEPVDSSRMVGETELNGVWGVWLEKYPGYAVTMDGTAWTFWKKTKVGKTIITFMDLDKTPKALGAHLDSDGYPTVHIKRPDGRRVQRNVHKLMLLGFIGERPKGMESRHLDGNKLHNHLSNLVYGTYEENNNDRRLHGTMPLGEKNVRAKLTDETVIEARKLWKTGATAAKLAKQYGVSENTLWQAVAGETWKHLDEVESPWKPGRWSER